MIEKTTCVNCGYEFLDDPDLQPRTLCPECGDSSRKFSISLTDSVTGMSVASATGKKVLIAPQANHYSDYEQDWESLLPIIEEGEYTIENKTLSGDAPKELITLNEYGLLKIAGDSLMPSYVAKTGIKKYPNESITEQLNTRVAQVLGLNPALSALCVITKQVRFLSNYFLGADDELIHGVQILEAKLGEEYVREVA